MITKPEVFAQAGRHCRNLTDQIMRPGGPWMFQPAELRTLCAPLHGISKKKRTALLSSPGSNFMVYSIAEGVNAGGRINTKTNPPRVVHGLVCDYDHPMTEEGLLYALDHQQRSGQVMPHWLERSLSGQLHAVWFFEEPLCGPGELSLWEAVLDGIAEKIGAKNFFPGFDSKSTSPAQIWTASGDGTWVMLDEGEGYYPLVKKSLIEGVFDAKVTEWAKVTGDQESDMTPERVLPLLQEKFKEQFQWDGAFVEGSMGPTFWLEGSQSPKSAKVLRNGMYSFSETAASIKHTFWSWAELIGSAAYEMHKTADLPERIAGIWYDGSKYYIAPAEGSRQWRVEDLIGITRHLLAKRGVSTRVPKGREKSEMADALEFIHQRRLVAGAGPVAFRPRGVQDNPSGDGTQMINTSMGTVLPPAAPEGNYHWGPGGGFENLCQFLEVFLPPDPTGRAQLPYWCAWMARFYKGAYNLDVEHGHIMVVVGEPGTGKTFMTEVILREIFRLVCNAGEYLMTDTRFTGGLYASGLWLVDDVAKAALDPVQLASRLKKELTQAVHYSEDKFRKAVQVSWCGRCAIFTNPDVDSLSVVPCLDEQSNTAKFLLFKTCKTEAVAGFDFKVLAGKIKAELPAFCAWLLKYELPPEVKRESRFGFFAYQHPDVKDTLELSNLNFSLTEYLRRWQQDIASTQELSSVDEVAYDQPGLISSIEASWLTDLGHNTPLVRQLHERRFVQRFSGLIETGKLHHVKHVKSADGRRQWVVNLKGIRRERKK